MTADTVGGVWTYSLTLAKALERHGISVYLATMGAPLAPDQWKQARALENLTVFESSFRLEWMDEPWEDVRRAGDWLLDLEGHLAPDIVHLNGYVHGSREWRGPVIAVGHSCVLSWWSAVKGEPAPDNWERYRDEVRRGLAAADCVAAPSRAMLSELRRRYAPLRRAVVIPNACDPREFAPRPKEPIVFSAGRMWDEAKNIAALDRIAAAIEWPVFIAGDSTHPNGSGYVPGGARTLGRLSCASVREWYAKTAIYALPARYEPFGLSILEAALSGCALVLGDIPSLRENWDGAAVFVSPDDDNALTRAINMLIADDDARWDLSTKARQRGLRFTPTRMASGYLDMYRAALASREVKTCA